jgi:hypothetical protein
MFYHKMKHCHGIGGLSPAVNRYCEKKAGNRAYDLTKRAQRNIILLKDL